MFNFDGSQLHLYALGRNAMFAACEALRLQPGDEVLTPAYDCDGALQPFRLKNLKLKFYRVHPRTFEVDLDHVKTLLSPRTKLFHVINYFGYPQNWARLLRFRSETQIPILEDNAYSLFSSYQNQWLGKFGDFSVFSLRKFFSLPDGGLLINNSKWKIHKLRAKIRFRHGSDWFRAARFMLRQFSITQKSIKSIARLFCLNTSAKVPLYDSGHPPAVPQRDQIPRTFRKYPLRSISKFSLYYYKKYTQPEFLNYFLQRKKQIYQRLVPMLLNIEELDVLYPDIQDGIVPFGIYLLIDGKVSRDKIFDRLRRKYTLLTWPTFPSEVIQNLRQYPEAKQLGRSMLIICLPFHEVISPRAETRFKFLISDLKAILTA